MCSGVRSAPVAETLRICKLGTIVRGRDTHRSAVDRSALVAPVATPSLHEPLHHRSKHLTCTCAYVGDALLSFRKCVIVCVWSADMPAPCTITVAGHGHGWTLDETSVLAVEAPVADTIAEHAGHAGIENCWASFNRTSSKKRRIRKRIKTPVSPIKLLCCYHRTDGLHDHGWIT